VKNFKYIILLLFITTIFAQTKNIYSFYDFDPVVITGSRIPTEFSNSSRNISVIDEQTIRQQNAESIESLLMNLTDLEFKTRGPLGIQSDVSIRGASNEQTLILLDGMKISDPQTAHHSLNIPINLDDIAQIEILKGNASKLYGPNALGGVINIITKNSEKTNGNLRLSAGDNGYAKGDLSLALLKNNISNRFSFSQKRSDGYIKNTDFDVRNIFYKAGLQTYNTKYDLSFGYQRKDFGANRFYTPSKTEREQMEQFLANLSSFHSTEWGHLAMKFSGRKNYDHFIIPQYNYENKHTTHLYSAEVNGFYNTSDFVINFGTDIGYNDISGRVMNDERYHVGLFSESTFKLLKKIELTPGASAYYYEDWGLQFFPGLDIGYNATGQFRIFSSIGRSFRVPSFTDLSYVGVANMGNDDLKPETAVSYELGAKHVSERLQTTATLFHRNTTDMIEYVKDISDENAKYTAQNISKIKINGFELSTKHFINKFTINTLAISYSKINYDYDFDKYEFKYKYALNSLAQKYSIIVNQKLPFKIIANWNINYQERVHDDGNGQLLTNLNISFPLMKVNVNFNIMNLFDEQYKNFMEVPMPGRWIKAGIEYKI